MKTRISITLIGLMLISIYFTSCQHEPEPILTPALNTAICFTTDVLPIINHNCNVSGCHGEGEAPALDSYERIHNYVTDYKPMQSKLHKVIIAHSNLMGLMPPKPKPSLSSHQIDIISIWILQGAKPPTETCP
jgi:hypothetical protein